MTTDRKRVTKQEPFETQDEYHALICVWMLNMLLGTDAAFRGFYRPKHGVMDSDVADFLQLADIDETRSNRLNCAT